MNEEKTAHTDIVPHSWFDNVLPVMWRPYARLMRLDRPIGTWLLLLPCWWGLALAPDEPIGKTLWLALCFAAGSIIMRGAGCVINDCWDRDFDRQVERTRQRPVASGVISLKQAFIFLGVLLFCGLLVLLQFNAATIWLAMAALPLVVIYPLMKRITQWPQLVLGLTFNWGALLGWMAIQNDFAWPMCLLYGGGVFWTLGYDTIYAHQDKRDDALAGVKSLALALDTQSASWITVFFVAALLSFLVAGWLAQLGAGFYVGLAAALAHAFWQIKGWQPDSPANCLQRFRSNRDFGGIILAALIAGRLF